MGDGASEEPQEADPAGQERVQPDFRLSLSLSKFMRARCCCCCCRDHTTWGSRPLAPSPPGGRGRGRLGRLWARPRPLEKGQTQGPSLGCPGPTRLPLEGVGGGWGLGSDGRLSSAGQFCPLRQHRADSAAEAHVPRRRRQRAVTVQVSAVSTGLSCPGNRGGRGRKRVCGEQTEGGPGAGVVGLAPSMWPESCFLGALWGTCAQRPA